MPPGFAWPDLAGIGRHWPVQGGTGYRFNCVFGITHYQRNALVASRTAYLRRVVFTRAARARPRRHANAAGTSAVPAK